MAARGEKDEVGKSDTGGQPRGQGVRLQMVDCDERFSGRQRDALSGHQSDQDPADQARTRRRGDAVEVRSPRDPPWRARGRSACRRSRHGRAPRSPARRRHRLNAPRSGSSLRRRGSRPSRPGAAARPQPRSRRRSSRSPEHASVRFVSASPPLTQARCGAPIQQRAYRGGKDEGTCPGGGPRWKLVRRSRSVWDDGALITGWGDLNTSPRLNHRSGWAPTPSPFPFRLPLPQFDPIWPFPRLEPQFPLPLQSPRLALPLWLPTFALPLQFPALPLPLSFPALPLPFPSPRLPLPLPLPFPAIEGEGGQKRQAERQRAINSHVGSRTSVASLTADARKRRVFVFREPTSCPRPVPPLPRQLRPAGRRWTLGAGHRMKCLPPLLLLPLPIPFQLPKF